MSEIKTQDITLQAEREKRETIEFVELLKTMSKEEKHELRLSLIHIPSPRDRSLSRMPSSA